MMNFICERILETIYSDGDISARKRKYYLHPTNAEHGAIIKFILKHLITKPESCYLTPI